MRAPITLPLQPNDRRSLDFVSDQLIDGRRFRLTWVDERVAAKNGCIFVTSSRLKPVKFVAGELLMTDGTRSGWSDPNLYIIYVNAP